MEGKLLTLEPPNSVMPPFEVLIPDNAKITEGVLNVAPPSVDFANPIPASAVVPG